MDANRLLFVIHRMDYKPFKINNLLLFTIPRTISFLSLCLYRIFMFFFFFLFNQRSIQYETITTVYRNQDNGSTLSNLATATDVHGIFPHFRFFLGQYRPCIILYIYIYVYYTGLLLLLLFFTNVP